MGARSSRPASFSPHPSPAFLHFFPSSPYSASTSSLHLCPPPPASASAFNQVEDSLQRFDAYLCLPPEEYSLLDPKWIQREGPDLFRLSVPLGELLGEFMGTASRGSSGSGGGGTAQRGMAAIVPSVYVRSTLDSQTQTVRSHHATPHPGETLYARAPLLLHTHQLIAPLISNQTI